MEEKEHPHRLVIREIKIGTTTCSMSTGCCACGATLCGNKSPRDGIGCLLEKGHQGPHKNDAAVSDNEWPNI